ncbi:MAG: ABC transporter ATP-binding protein [Dysgonamonadaceae bacterium]|nr:ABC transporter ATP-binding protein [Dysgonamonadaceae bacterium]MDD4729411.1 ABC transporter ATP-binding protein [Dysgonamonadaceae bacterium]
MIKRVITQTLKWKIAIQVVLSLIATFSLAMIPGYNKYLVDNVLPNGGSGLFSLVGMYLASYFVFLFATWGSERYVWKCAIAFENTLKKICFDSVFSKNFRSFSEQKSDEYLSLMTNNITSIEQDYLQPVCALIKSIFSVCVYVVVISINTSPIICAFLILLSIVAAFTPQIYKKQLKRAGKEYVDEAATYTKKISDLLDGFELADNNSRPAYSRVNEKFTDFLSQKRLNLGRKKVNGNTISGAAICIIDILTFVLCGVLLVNGDITAGTVLAAITYAQSFTEPIQEILYDLNALNASKDIVNSLEKIFTDDGKYNDIEVKTPQKDIVLRDLSVTYSDKVLHYTVDFAVGNKYMIKGESGSGKSTLLNALMERCDYSGDIFIDGSASRLDDNKVFYMSQNQHVFSESFLDNATIFKTYSLPDEQTLRKLPLYENIFDSQDCSTLSGGEQQVMKICRMLSQEKEFILVDEPFSAIDTENRKKLFHLLSESRSTIILVAHDLDFEASDLTKWTTVKIEDICNEIRV